MKYTRCPKCGSTKLATRGEATVTIYQTFTKDGRLRRKVVAVNEVTDTHETWCAQCGWQEPLDDDDYTPAR